MQYKMIYYNHRLYNFTSYIHSFNVTNQTCSDSQIRDVNQKLTYLNHTCPDITERELNSTFLTHLDRSSSLDCSLLCEIYF